jgi:hypothetical protein
MTVFGRADETSSSARHYTNATPREQIRYGRGYALGTARAHPSVPDPIPRFRVEQVHRSVSLAQ